VKFRNILWDDTGSILKSNVNRRELK